MPWGPSWGEALLFWLFLAVVLVAPLPFASVSPWAWAPLAAATGLLLAVWAFLAALGGAGVGIPLRRIALPGLLFAGVAVWMALQMAPFTPGSWHHPVWARASEALGGSLAGGISVDPPATAASLARLLWYGAVFWLALQLCRNEKLARRALAGLALAAVLYAAYGLAIEFSGARMVLWLEKLAYPNNVTSTFINRNSYATFAGIGLVVMTAAIARQLTYAPVRDAASGSRAAAVLVYLFGHGWHLLLGWAIVVTALLLTDSRAGVISGVIGLLVFLGAMGRVRRRARGGYLWVLPAVLAVLIGFFAISGDVVGKRLVRTFGASDLRFAIYDVTLDGILKTPYLGTGAGTFEEVFAFIRPETFSHRGVIVRAHSTYLENALELGIPAAAALVLAVVLLALVCLLGVRRRRNDAYYPALGFAASVLVGLHSVVDFSLQIPAVSVTYAFVLGLACAQSWGSREQL